MRKSRLFISYRRDDSAGYARAIAGEMTRRFGAERVFIDVDDIAPGRGFAEAIHQALASALLVLIGPRWQGKREGQAPRLDEPDDFVRREVAALARGLRVIPVLVDGAPPPPTPPTCRRSCSRWPACRRSNSAMVASTPTSAGWWMR